MRRKIDSKTIAGGMISIVMAVLVMLLFPVQSDGAYNFPALSETNDNFQRNLHLPSNGPIAASKKAIRNAMLSRMKSQLLDSCMPYSDVTCNPQGMVTKWTDGRVNRSLFRVIKSASARIHRRNGEKTAYVVSWYDREKKLVDFAAFESIKKRRRFMDVLQFMVEGQRSLQTAIETLGEKTPLCATREEAAAVLEKFLSKSLTGMRFTIDDTHLEWMSRAVGGDTNRIVYQEVKEVISGEGKARHEDGLVKPIYMCLLKTPRSGKGYTYFEFNSLADAQAVHHALEVLRDLPR